MAVFYLILLLLAAVCFLGAAVNAVVYRRINLLALGLFFWVLVPLIHTIRVV